MQTLIENWLTIPNSRGYEVSNYGNVRNKAGKPVKCHKISTGYLIVVFYRPDMSRCTTLVHTLVADMFLINQPKGKYVVHHIDGNRCNNVVTNLEYTDYSSNLKAAYSAEDEVSMRNIIDSMGGETECQLQCDISSGMPVMELSRLYGLTRSQVVRLRRYYNAK